MRKGGEVVEVHDGARVHGRMSGDSGDEVAGGESVYE